MKTAAIAGSGIVATTIAYQLVQHGWQVTLFEKGPDYPYPHTQQYQEKILYLYNNPAWKLPDDIRGLTQSGTYKRNIDGERGMVVGGSATHWWGVTPRMIPEDFRTRTLFGYGEDWPITYDELEPYYVRAERFIGVSGTTEDNPFAPPRSAPYPLPPFALSYGDKILKERLAAHGIVLHTTPQARTRLPYDGRPGCANFGVCHVCPIGVRYSPTHHLQRAVATGRCEVRPNTTVRRVLMESNGRARALLVQENEAATPYEFPADVIIIAAGAIESARLLLLSRDARYPDGVGNHSGWVGRGLTFHHIWSSGLIFDEPLYTGRVGPATGRSFQFLNPETRGRHGGINLGLDDRVDLRWLLGAENLWNVRDPEEIVHRMSDIPFKRGINFHAESIPSEDKYVTLSEKKDRFGDPMAHVHYESDAFDYATFEYAQALFRRLVEALRPKHARMGDDPDRFNSGAHHMGTCRMSERPEAGVVDSFGRVHGTRNLFVGGGAVFVGGSGAVQPTLTMVALALRTADYLLDQFGT